MTDVIVMRKGRKGIRITNWRDATMEPRSAPILNVFAPVTSSAATYRTGRGKFFLMRVAKPSPAPTPRRAATSSHGGAPAPPPRRPGGPPPVPRPRRPVGAKEGPSTACPGRTERRAANRCQCLTDHRLRLPSPVLDGGAEESRGAPAGGSADAPGDVFPTRLGRQHACSWLARQYHTRQAGEGVRS